MSKKLFLGLLFVLATTVYAQASVANFESYTPIDTCSGNIFDGGLQFASVGGIACAWTANPNDSTNAYIAGFGTGTSISQQGGGSFDLFSVDMAISWYDDSPSETVSYDAFFFGGGSTSGTLTLIQGLQTYNLGLTGLDHIDIGALTGAGCGTGSGVDAGGFAIVCPGYWVLDNLDSSAIAQATPEPASLTLMALGLVGLLVFRKRLV